MVENMDEPVTKNEKFNVAGLSLLQDFWETTTRMLS